MKKPPSNPYLTALFILSGLALGMGVILLIVGAQAAAQASFFSSDAGMEQTQMGGSFLSIGFLCLVIALAAAAITWKPTESS